MPRIAVFGRSRSLLSLLGPAVLAGPALAGADVCFVDATATAGGDGSSWQMAYQSLGDALEAAAEPASTIASIRISGGTYLPPRPEGEEANAREATFVLISGVSLEGGYAGLAGGDPDQRDPLAHPTVLSGDLKGDDAPGFINRADNVFQVVTAFDLDETTIIDGLTIRGGEAFGARLGDVRASKDQGAAIHLWGGSPTFRNVTIDDNRALSHGIVNDHSDAARFESCRFLNGATESHAAGIYCSPTSASTIIDCHFERNQTEGNGGGFYNDGSRQVSCIDSTFVDNVAVRGSGAFTADDSAGTITGCTFESNRASRAGAGIFNSVNETVISGCTFIGNDAMKAEGGGGIWNENGAPVITDCVFMYNRALQGGGVYSIDAHPIVLRSTFIGNEAQSGGATWNDGGFAYTADCTFIDNIAVTGGGVYNENGESIVVDCHFEGNEALDGDGGGGMTNSFHSIPTIIGCTFNENLAVNGLFGGGGGMANYVATVTVYDCEFTRNSASLSGGAMYTEANDDAGPCYFSHCTFNGNRAADGAALHLFRTSPFVNHCVFVGNAIEGEGTGRGGAIYNHFISFPEITNCTMIENVAPFGAAIADADLSEPVVANSILWNRDGGDVVWGEMTTFAFSLVRSSITGPGVIDTDPLVMELPDAGADGEWGTADDEYGDVSLSALSPAIDAGHNGLVARDRADRDDDGDTTEFIATDRAGMPRFQDVTGAGCGVGGVVDLGAYEFAGVPHDVLVGDLDGDGMVGLTDLIVVLREWGTCADACCFPDMDRSGDVDFNDLLAVLGRWTR